MNENNIKDNSVYSEVKGCENITDAIRSDIGKRIYDMISKKILDSSTHYTYNYRKSIEKYDNINENYYNNRPKTLEELIDNYHQGKTSKEQNKMLYELLFNSGVREDFLSILSKITFKSNEDRSNVFENFSYYEIKKYILNQIINIEGIKEIENITNVTQDWHLRIIEKGDFESTDGKSGSFKFDGGKYVTIEKKKGFFKKLFN